MKYYIIIPETKYDKIIFKYMDTMYGDLEQVDSNEMEGDIIFRKPNSTGAQAKYGIFALADDELYIYNKIVDEVAFVFSSNNVFASKIIAKWLSKKYNIHYTKTTLFYL